MEILFIVSGVSVVIGLILGWCIGTDGFNQKTFWTRCKFEGDPPSDYKSWNHWMMSRVKCDVIITKWR